MATGISGLNGLIQKPVFLAPDNFTPLSRTPWAGTRIMEKWKNGLVAAKDMHLVGESWEFSCDPSFPTKLTKIDVTLSEIVKAYPKEVLGSLYQAQEAPTCELLVKLIDTNHPLSLQIHPTDQNERLKDNECGKPEAWYVLDVDQQEGAGLYLGFSKPIEKTKLKERILSNDDVASLLEFVPVKPGDYFDIPAGVPHAIGPGLTLLEPQRVLFGKSGKTYRMWDWGRRYDEKGNPNSESGKPRELHLEDALELCDPMVQHGPNFVASLRKTPEIKQLGGLSVATYPSNDFCQLTIIDSTSNARFKVEGDSYLVLTVLNGSVLFGAGESAKRGQTVLLPACSLPLSLTLEKFASLSILRPIEPW